jgi:hypothetical protein
MSDRHREDSASNEIEASVVGYLRHHPQAADTVEGIVNWWLPRQRYASERASIERALGRLVDAGVLKRSRLPDGVDLFALNHSPEQPARSG